MEGEWAPAARRILEYLIIRLQYRKEEQLEGFTALGGTLVVSVDIEESVQLVNQSRCTTVIAAKSDFCHELLSDQMRREMESLLSLCQSRTLSGRGCPHESLHAMPFQLSFELYEKSGILRKDCLEMKQFIHRLSLVHTKITFHYCVKANGSISAKTYGFPQMLQVTVLQTAGDSWLVGMGNTEKRDSICLPDGIKLLNDGSHFVRKAVWSCDKIHPLAGDPVDLFIPDKVAERGFSGQLKLTPVVSLCPCQKLFPNQPTRIATASIFVSDPAGLPILFTMKEACPFFEDPSRLALWERFGYQATLNSDPYWEEDDQRAILAHLYPILLCSEQAVKGTIHTVVNRILEQHCREEQVDDTQELQVTIKKAINKVTLKRWRASSVCDIRKPLPKKDEARQLNKNCALSPVNQKFPCSSISSGDLEQRRKDSCRGEGLLCDRPDCDRRSQTKKRRPASRELSVEDSRGSAVPKEGQAKKKRSGLLAKQDTSLSSSFSHLSKIRPASFLVNDGGSSVENRAGSTENLWQDDDFWNWEVSNLSQWIS